MRLLRKWPFALFMAALFLCAIGCWTFGRHGMWLSSGICLALFSGMAAYLYNQQNRQLKRWHTFIHGKHNLPPKERLLPDNASARTMNDIKQELEQLTDSYHHRLLNEAIRQKYYETLLNHVETGVMTCTPTGEIQWMNHAARQQFGTHPRVPAAWLKLPAGDTQVTTVERHGMTKDYAAECENYERAIQAYGGIDLLLGGIGTDGHIAFNEPFSSLSSRTRIKTLAPSTIKDNSRFFGNDITKVPTQALTIGIGTIMDAKEVIIMALGTNKAEAIRQGIEGCVNHLWPITALQQHRYGIIVCDKEAASGLSKNTVGYFKSIESPAS